MSKSSRNSPPTPAGYSGTPLVRKLGIKEGHRLWLDGIPDHYWELLGPLPDGVDSVGADGEAVDFAHVFATTIGDLERALAEAKSRIAPNGMVWASWPKKASGVETELDGNVVRRLGLDCGLVDVKVCAVDAIWSGLKFVYRVADRGA